MFSFLVQNELRNVWGKNKVRLGEERGEYVVREKARDIQGDHWSRSLLIRE